ncbi:zona pellucida sperm-binding protein 2-like [Acipenser oxyrinchus oxyrinchus]|uniref:Zona pellucida sperm-binding protein 2-like n=1 Tax=Acipenser oxyrinchus oxyrinchus TaxID=40147 RepID=A0AAD8G4P7_ACIOX|nr:zona pellucida sperm-binding protein 2-like [Acipenser oxyrinchus oxyrinchus]
MTLELPLEAAADHQLFVFDQNNKPIQIDPAYELKCQYTVEVVTVFQLRVGYGACEVQEQNKSLFLAVQISYFSKSLGQTVTKKYQMVCLPTRSDNLQISREVGKTRCTQSFMEVMLPQQLPNFDPISNTPQEWLVSINNGQTTTTMTLLQARSKGYEFTVANNLMIVRAYFTATGIQKFGRLQSDKVLYLADLTLTYDTGFGKITILVLMICVPAPVSCNRMNVLIEIPPLPRYSQTTEHVSITVPKRYPLAQTMACPLGFLTGVKTVLPDTKLTFNVRGTLTSMTFTPVCPCEMKGSDPAVVLCQDGFMDFEVRSNDTLPPLDLGTVQLRDPTCRPSVSSKDSLLFHVPLASCGTTSKVINGKLVYENEIRALLKDRPVLGVIGRDSEYLLTVQCYYDHTADANLIVAVKTNAPPPPAMEQGDLIVVLRAYPDVLHYRRFEVKMFTFVSGGVLQTNPIYFHCSTLICDLLKPDSDLCAKTCPSSASVRRRRGLGSAGSTAVLGEVNRSCNIPRLGKLLDVGCSFALVFSNDSCRNG